MKFFFWFFTAFTAICGLLWYLDEPGSGMGYATGISATIMVGVGIYNWRKNGSPLADGPRKS